LFATEDTLAKAAALNIKVTWSQSATSKKSLLSVLSDGLPKKKWRLATIPHPESYDQHYFVYNDSKLVIGIISYYNVNGV
jgi:hypothetical protein